MEDIQCSSTNILLCVAGLLFPFLCTLTSDSNWLSTTMV